MGIKISERPCVGFLLNSFDNLYYNLICKELTSIFEACKEYEFSLLYSCNEIFLTEDDIKRCVLQRIDLIITHLPPSKDALELASLNNINIVTVGSINELGLCDNISIDNKMGCVLAAKYLSNFHTNDKYVYVGIDYFLSERRFEMFKKELSDCGFDDVINFNSDKDDVKALYALIQEGYRSIFFYNDLTAYKTLYLLDKLAIDIRRLYPDLHIIGFDGLCASVYGLREITSIKMDFKEYASQTYELIKERLENPKSPPKRVTLPVYIYQRTKRE
jgi:DNA-binding LacI/PurR family transcriptional regulator